MRISYFILGTVLALMAGCAPEPATIVEASGVFVRDGELLIVDDSQGGAFFQIPFADQSPNTVIALNEASPVKVDMPDIGTWVDLEAIDMLADGRIVMLSERLRSIVGAGGMIAEYDYPLGEIGRRGLEGLAVRPLPDGGSRIAVLWEGGYPDPGSLHPELEKIIGAQPFLPVIFVHDLAPNAKVGRVRWEKGVDRIELKVPLPEGNEPEAQRFRSPAIVWYRTPGGGENEWGFIALLSSQNAVPKRSYLYHWLLRFDMKGNAVGEPIDLAKTAPEPIGNANWEGLCWLERGKSLVLVHEGIGDLEPHAFVLELPEDWQTSM